MSRFLQTFLSFYLFLYLYLFISFFKRSRGFIFEGFTGKKLVSLRRLSRSLVAALIRLPLLEPCVNHLLGMEITCCCCCCCRLPRGKMEAGMEPNRRERESVYDTPTNIVHRWPQNVSPGTISYRYHVGLLLANMFDKVQNTG